MKKTKILIIQKKMIGDVLTSTLFFEYLKRKNSLVELHYLVDKNTLPVIKNNPYIDKVIVFDFNEEGKRSFFQLISEIRKENYTDVIDAFSNLKTAVISFLSGSKNTIGYQKSYTSILYRKTYQRKQMIVSGLADALNNRLNLLSHFGVEYNPKIVPKIILSSEEIENAKAYLFKNEVDVLTRSVYMISVLGSGIRKTYPAVYMAEVLDCLASQIEDNSVLLFNYIPSQYNDVKEVYNLCKTDTQDKIKLDVYGSSLREFLAITHFCKALIGNEGGAVNMAKALGVPTFSIFAPNINKLSWALFEEKGKHESVHLREFAPEKYKDFKKGDASKNVIELYQDFKPFYILPQLRKYIESI